MGTLKVGPTDLRLVIHVSAEKGGYAARLDSIDQGAKGLPLQDVVFKDGILRFELKVGKATFEGKANEAVTEIAGTWKQSGLSLPLTFKRTAKAPELARPQEPKGPFPYREEEVVFENKKAKVRLAGTLTLPRGKGPFPAVMLITGSGPQDRDETIFGHKPFLVLADHLTRKGVAVLRADDRGVGKSKGSMVNATTSDLAGDALAGVHFLKGRADIDPRRVGLVGHSEGGVIAPLVAADSPDVAFLVLLAGPGLPGDELLALQSDALLKASGVDEETRAWSLNLQKRILRLLKEEKQEQGVEKKALEILKEELAKREGEGKKDFDALRPVVEAQLRKEGLPWLRFYLAHDPRPVLKKVTVPVLALIGEKDLQVPPRENLGEIARALKEGGNRDYTVKELPGLNHLFQRARTGLVSEYNQIEETFAPAALGLIADWIVDRVKEKAKGPSAD